MLVAGQQGAQRFGVQPFGADHRRGLVAGQVTVRCWGCGDLSASTQHARLSMGVGIERRFQRRGVVEHDDVGRDQGGALVQELQEGVLSVGAGRAEQHAARVPCHRVAIKVGAFAQRLHLELLQVVRQAPQRPRVGQYGVRLCTPEIAVPDPQQAHQRWQIAFDWGVGEMRVDGVRTAVQCGDDRRPAGDLQHQTHGRPKRVAAAHPVAEGKALLASDAPFAGALRVGCDGNKVALDLCWRDAAVQQPVAGALRVGQRLQGAESL